MFAIRMLCTAHARCSKFIHESRIHDKTILDISPEVIAAINSNKPVVALESAIITHGLPYPTNLSTARSVENIIRQQGVVPATIGVVNGKIKVGLDDSSLIKLASPETSKVKISKCDFPYVLSKGLTGGTTVAGTLIAANIAGINIFVTGGIGGVHRDVQETMDISADLFEISRTPILVVCSGVKSILDIGKTLEYLETLGVCTVVYDENSKHFPAFYSLESGHQSQYNVGTPNEVADLLYNVRALNLQSGILLAVPIPTEFAIDGMEIERFITEGLRLAREKSIKGKSLTPFLLSFIGNLTNNKSLASNVALIENNAKVGSHIAISLQQKYGKSGLFSPRMSNLDQQKRSFSTARTKRPVVIGGSIMDCVARAYEPIQVKIMHVYFFHVFNTWDSFHIFNTWIL